MGTEIWAYDHNPDHLEYPDYVMKNVPGVNTVAWHCYTMGILGPSWTGAGLSGWKPLTKFHEAHPGVKQIMSECFLTSTGSWSGFFHQPDFITGPLQNYASGVISWILAGS